MLPPRTLSHRPPYPMNNSRIPIESRCPILDRETGPTQTFVLGASCKTERVGAERDLFLEPERRLHAGHLRRFVHAPQDLRPDRDARSRRFPPGSGDQPDRLRVPIKGTYVSMVLDLRRARGRAARRSEGDLSRRRSPATRSSPRRHPARPVRGDIEYPVKTMNANEREWVYQTDTGPVLFPDLDAPPEQLHERLDVAFEAHNAPDWAQFIVRRPTRDRGRRRGLPLLRVRPRRRRRERHLPHPHDGPRPRGAST